MKKLILHTCDDKEVPSTGICLDKIVSVLIKKIFICFDSESSSLSSISSSSKFS